MLYFAVQTKTNIMTASQLQLHKNINAKGNDVKILASVTAARLKFNAMVSRSKASK